MNKKWLLKEIQKWQSERIIDDQCADILKQRYSVKSNNNTLTIIFSVLGSLLVGTGILLIFAKNWYQMPTGIKAFLSVIPLLTGQGLAVFTVIKKYKSLVWREGVAIFYSAGVFTALAMIGQSFHIANDFGTYVLSCGLLVLPIIFILDAVSPLVVYFYSIINWGFLASSYSEAKYSLAILLLLFFTIGLLYVILHRKETSDIRHIYTIWISVIAGGVLITAFSLLLNLDDLDYFIIYLIYFAFLLAFDKGEEGPLLPYKPIGILGGLVIMMLFSSAWVDFYSSAGDNIIIAIVPLAGVMLLGIKHHKFHIQKLQLLSVFVLFTIVVIVSSYFSSRYFIAVVANILTGLIGIGFIVNGAKSSNLSVTNLGLLITCGLILMRFFDENIDFLWRGIAFLILGGIFLFINYRIMKNRKRTSGEKEALTH